MMAQIIRQLLEDSIAVKRRVIEAEIPNIELAVKAIVSSMKKGGKVLVFGNGGSAADSQHIAAEFVGRFKRERRALPAIALTANTSTLTALGNDYSYDYIFERQIEALGRKGDIALGISTSGNSNNCVAALKKAKEMGLFGIAFTGQGGGGMKRYARITIAVDSKDTPRVQESHITVGHIICQLVEDALCGLSR